MNEAKCETHDKEIVEIRTEFHEYKRNTNVRLDEILDKLKPQFTSAQITSLLLTLVVYMAGIMLYISSIKEDVRVNSVKVQVSETRYENINLKLDKLLQDVAVLKSKN